MRAMLRRLWAWWEPIARAIGHAQAQAVLVVIYLGLLWPFALLARAFRGASGSGPFAPGSFWTERPPEDHSVTAAERQF